MVNYSNIYQYVELKCNSSSCTICNAYCNDEAHVNLTAINSEFVPLLFSCYGPLYFDKIKSEEKKEQRLLPRRDHLPSLPN